MMAWMLLGWIQTVCNLSLLGVGVVSHTTEQGDAHDD